MSGLIRNEDVAYIRENVRIDEVVSDYLPLKSAGGDQKKGLCPFHGEKSPSFHVTPSKGYFHWDEYPYILLNLMLSFQAAYSTPFILMSQNRQTKRDRKKSDLDLKIDIITEKELKTLSSKVDIHNQKDNVYFKEIIKNQKAILEQLKNKESNENL